jgi:hypothetical protein
MFIKLNFTSNKNAAQALGLLHHIITNPTITNVETFNSTLSSLHSGIYTGFDAGNSEIIRTVNPDRVVSQLQKTATANNVIQTLQFDFFNSLNKKYYLQISSPDGTVINIRISDTIGGSQDLSTRTSFDLGTSVSGTSSGGDTVTFTNSVNSADTLAETLLNAGSSTAAIRCIWAYITNDCFIFTFTQQNSTPAGWGTSYGSTNSTGPYIFSQYQPFDQYMKPENGIAPLMFTSLLRGGGFGTIADWDFANNTLFTKPTTANPSSPAFQILNGIDAYPAATSTWPKLRAPYVSWGSGSRTNEQFALSAEALGSTTTIGTARYGRVFNTAVYYRYPSADRKTTGFSMMPLRWELSYYSLRGGNATARGGMYIFNGEYVAGDLFNYNGKTYMIWPTAAGYTARIGLAIPKE